MERGIGIWLIRHAPVIGDGGVCGRRDLPADCSGAAAFAALRGHLPAAARRLRSPARRCAQTAEALLPGAWESDPRLWEQDFGAWEGAAYAELPDLGPLSPADLAVHRPPGGESFADLCTRCRPVFEALVEETVIVAHAGTIRAALAFALGAVAPALAFEIAPLSLSRITLLSGGACTIGAVNTCP